MDEAEEMLSALEAEEGEGEEHTESEDTNKDEGAGGEGEKDNGDEDKDEGAGENAGDDEEEDGGEDEEDEGKEDEDDKPKESNRAIKHKKLVAKLDQKDDQIEELSTTVTELQRTAMDFRDIARHYKSDNERLYKQIEELNERLLSVGDEAASDPYTMRLERNLKSQEDYERIKEEQTKRHAELEHQRIVDNTKRAWVSEAKELSEETGVGAQEILKTWLIEQTSSPDSNVSMNDVANSLKSFYEFKETSKKRRHAKKGEEAPKTNKPSSSGSISFEDSLEGMEKYLESLG